MSQPIVVKMFGFLKPNIEKQSSADPGSLDSVAKSDGAKITPGRRTTSEPVLITPDMANDKIQANKARTRGPSPAAYDNDFADSGGLENQGVQELEEYAVHKSEETTKSVNNCLRIAEDIKGTASSTLEMLHDQGEQINRTHAACVDMDKDLSKGEKLLNGLGGIFSKPWKPKKTKEINGPDMSIDTTSKRATKEQREKLGVSPAPEGGKSAPRTPPPEGASAMQQIDAEKAKQDDALSDLSNILGDLKGMAMDMGSELERQNKAMDHLSEDVDELNSRMKGANQRTRKLLEK